jgi:hypothetical protein
MMRFANCLNILPLAAAAVVVSSATVALAADPIVGTWVGDVTQPDVPSFETRLSFVSPRGGVSRYPSFPCGGLLQGDRKGDVYEYNETIIWGGIDERSDGCIGGVVKIEVNGNKLKYDWSTHYNGKDYTASGELRRVK